MKTTATAVLALLILGAPTAAAAASTAPTPAPTAVECDPFTERPAVWDPVTGDVILCESRGDGPATGPHCDPTDCQLPTIPVESAEPAPPAATEPLAPVVHDELPETGLTPAGVLLVAFAIAAICFGCILVLAARARQVRLDRPHTFHLQGRQPATGQHVPARPLYRRRT